MLLRPRRTVLATPGDTGGRGSWAKTAGMKRNAAARTEMKRDTDRRRAMTPPFNGGRVVDRVGWEPARPMYILPAQVARLRQLQSPNDAPSRLHRRHDH